MFNNNEAILGENDPESVNAAADGAVWGHHVVRDEPRIDFNWSSCRLGQSWLASVVSLDILSLTHVAAENNAYLGCI